MIWELDRKHMGHGGKITFLWLQLKYKNCFLFNKKRR